MITKDSLFKIIGTSLPVFFWLEIYGYGIPIGFLFSFIVCLIDKTYGQDLATRFRRVFVGFGVLFGALALSLVGNRVKFYVAKINNQEEFGFKAKFGFLPMELESLKNKISVFGLTLSDQKVLVIKREFHWDWKTLSPAFLMADEWVDKSSENFKASFEVTSMTIVTEKFHLKFSAINSMRSRLISLENVEYSFGNSNLYVLLGLDQFLRLPWVGEKLYAVMGWAGSRTMLPVVFSYMINTREELNKLVEVSKENRLWSKNIVLGNLPIWVSKSQWETKRLDPPSKDADSPKITEFFYVVNLGSRFVTDKGVVLDRDMAAFRVYCLPEHEDLANSIMAEFFASAKFEPVPGL